VLQVLEHFYSGVFEHRLLTLFSLALEFRLLLEDLVHALTLFYLFAYSTQTPNTAMPLKIMMVVRAFAAVAHTFALVETKETLAA